MDRVADLPGKLDATLKALSLSRVGLAHQLEVDKSLVGRWLSGAVHPTEHNLVRLSSLVARSIPDFRLRDWFVDLQAFCLTLGVVEPVQDATMGGPLAEFLEAVRPELAFRAPAYEGFWRTSRPSVLIAERVFHDYGMIRRKGDGSIEVQMQGAGLDFSGQLFPVAGNVFVFLFDRAGRTPMTVLFKGVSLPRAMTLDGILLLAALDPNRTPAAVPIVIERIADLSGDADADQQRFVAIAQDHPEPLVPVGDEELRRRLFRDTGPMAAAQGGDGFLSVTPLSALSRGLAGDGLSG